MSANPIPVATDAASTKSRPSVALLLATAGGLGYLPKAPGTWGSVGGVALIILASIGAAATPPGDYQHRDYDIYLHVGVFLLTCIVGVWCASAAARYWNTHDPQRVVIDEVSGQYLAIMLGCGVPYFVPHRAIQSSPLGNITWHSALDWKYLLLGFILFRAFDIWKPFPARQAESFPGGWGIMADDWAAGFYAAICLWLARVAGL
jgi:phosphatidylglycerophosphatase A